MRSADDKCWICLSTDRDDWRKVCKCNLWVHEGCILQWDRTQGNTQCPQCRSPITIEAKRSNLLDIDTALGNIAAVVVGGAAASFAARLVLADLVYQALYEHGAASIRLMCSPQLASTILGPLWSVHGRLAPLGLGMFRISPQLVRLSVPQMLRQAVIPTIPLWLCGSGRAINPATCALSVLCMVLPWTGPLKAAVALAVARPFYLLFWAKCTSKYLRSLADKIFEQTQVDEYTAAVQQLEHIIDEAIDERGAPVEIPVDEQAEQAGQFMQALGDVVTIQNQRNGLFLLGKTSFVLETVQALASPLYSFALGKLLAKLPFLGKIETLYCNLLSFCLLTVGRDIWRLVLASKRAERETQRRVLNYGESSSSGRPLVLQWLLDITTPIQNWRQFINLDVRFA